MVAVSGHPGQHRLAVERRRTPDEGRACIASLAGCDGGILRSVPDTAGTSPGAPTGRTPAVGQTRKRATSRRTGRTVVGADSRHRGSHSRAHRLPERFRIHDIGPSAVAGSGQARSGHAPLVWTTRRTCPGRTTSPRRHLRRRPGRHQRRPRTTSRRHARQPRCHDAQRWRRGQPGVPDEELDSSPASAGAD